MTNNNSMTLAEMTLKRFFTTLTSMYQRDVHGDWSKAKEVWSLAVKEIKSPEDVTRMRSEYRVGLEQLNKLLKNKPNDSLRSHIEWISTSGKDMLDKKAKEIKENKGLNESFLDTITNNVKKLAKKMSSASSSVTKIAGLRATTYDEDIEDIKKEINNIKSDKQKSDLLLKIENIIKSLDMALDSFFEAKKDNPNSDELSVLIKGAKYYIDQFKSLANKVKGVKVVKVDKKAIERYSDEDDRSHRKSSDDDY